MFRNVKKQCATSTVASTTFLVGPVLLALVLPTAVLLAIVFLAPVLLAIVFLAPVLLAMC